jgi:hypothetical protein
MKLFYALLFALSLVGQTPPAVLSGPLDLTSQASDPSACYQLGSRYYNTTNQVTRVCTATGTPGTWANIGSGGTSTLVDWQAATNAITITSSDTTMYTTTAPPLPAGKCFAVSVLWNSSNGSAFSETAKLFYGANSVSILASNGGATGQQVYVAPFLICNNPGVQNAQQVTYAGVFNANNGSGIVYPGASGTASAVSTIATDGTQSQVIKFTVSAASGSPTMTGQAWKIDLLK